MTKFQFIPVLAIVVGLSLPTALRAQNPPMNCTPDGIIEVCTLVDTNAAPPAVEAVAPPAAPVPIVSYKNGQLTIIAENVPLSDVLHEVSRKTGARLEVPDGSATEPVFANIGPGSVRDVLAALLNGTKFNYVIAGSANGASGLESIVLTPVQQSGEVAQAGQIAQASNQPAFSPPAKAPEPAPSPAAAIGGFPFSRIDPAEIDRVRQQTYQTAMQEAEEAKKQGAAPAAASAPDSDPAN